MLETVLKDPNVDAVISLGAHFSKRLLSDWSFAPEMVLDVVGDRVEKPLSICTLGETLSLEELNRLTCTLNKKGILYYPSVESAVKALSGLYKYSKHLRN